MKIDDPRQQTVRAVFEKIREEAKDWRRPHLGASLIGHHCDRYIWMVFRWVQNPNHDGQQIALFSRGEEEERIVFERLRAIGVHVWDRNPETGKQWKVDLGSPHLGGSLDAVVLGLLEAPKSPHIQDVKTASSKRFRELKKVGAEKWSKQYVDQLQLYMSDRSLKINRAVLWVVCKDDDDIFMERFHYDAARAKRLRIKGEQIALAEMAPARVSENPSWYQCRMCDLFSTCHGEEVDKLERNCRTCDHVDVLPDGNWKCSFHGENLTLEEQKEGCSAHVFHEDLRINGAP